MGREAAPQRPPHFTPRRPTTAARGEEPVKASSVGDSPSRSEQAFSKEATRVLMHVWLLELTRRGTRIRNNLLLIQIFNTLELFSLFAELFKTKYS